MLFEYSFNKLKLFFMKHFLLLIYTICSSGLILAAGNDSISTGKNEFGLDMSSIFTTKSYGMPATSLNVIYKRIYTKGGLRCRLDISSGNSNSSSSNQNYYTSYEEYLQSGTSKISNNTFRLGYEIENKLKNTIFYYGCDFLASPTISKTLYTTGYVRKGDSIRIISVNESKNNSFGVGLAPFAGLRITLSKTAAICLENSMLAKWTKGTNSNSLSTRQEQKDTHLEISSNSSKIESDYTSLNFTNTTLNNLSIFLCIRF